MLVGIAVLCALWTPTPSQAAGVYFTRASVLKSFFADCDRVSYLEVTPDAAQQRKLRERLGYAVAGKRVVYYGEKNGKRRGYAVLDDTPGQHKDISFAVLMSPAGYIERVEVMVYREPKGDGVRSERFRKQFSGKTAAQPLQAGRDIVAVSGATISSRSLARGVKRAAALVEELVLPKAAPSVGRAQ